MTDTLATIDDATDIFCPECGYSLRGITSERCPECGRVVDREAAARSQIPWTHRKAIGAWRAYWRTVWLVFTDAKHFGEDVQRPVSFDDAQRFRRATVWRAFAPMALAVTILYLILLTHASQFSIHAWYKGEPAAAKLGAAMDYLAIPVIWISIYLTLLALSGVQSYFFHPSSLPIIKQNRAVAISYYACANLAFTFATLLSIAFLFWFQWMELDRKVPLLIAALAWLTAAAVVIVQIVGWWINCLRMLARSTHCSPARVWTMGATLPIIWGLLIAIIGFGIPLAYAFVCLVVLSLMRGY